MLTETVEVFKVGFVERISDDFNVQLVQVFGVKTFFKVRRYRVKNRIIKQAVDKPRGVSTRTVLNNSDILVATQRAAMESNMPNGWHFSTNSSMSRECKVPVMRRITLSIMYP